jgi:hypothetical protein
LHSNWIGLFGYVGGKATWSQKYICLQVLMELREWAVIYNIVQRMGNTTPAEHGTHA